MHVENTEQCSSSPTPRFIIVPPSPQLQWHMSLYIYRLSATHYTRPFNFSEISDRRQKCFNPANNVRVLDTQLHTSIIVLSSFTHAATQVNETVDNG